MNDDDEGITLIEENGQMTAEQKRHLRYLRVQEQGGVLTQVSRASEEGQKLVELHAKMRIKMEDEKRFILPEINTEDAAEQSGQSSEPVKKEKNSFSKMQVV